MPKKPNPGAFFPFYYKISTIYDLNTVETAVLSNIIHWIGKGMYKDGSFFKSDREGMEEIRCSRNTYRKAINKLLQLDLIKKVTHGRNNTNTYNLTDKTKGMLHLLEIPLYQRRTHTHQKVNGHLSNSGTTQYILDSSKTSDKTSYKQPAQNQSSVTHTGTPTSIGTVISNNPNFSQFTGHS